MLLRLNGPRHAVIYNLERREEVMRFPIEVDAENIVTFVYKGEIYAFFRHLHWPARLYRLTYSSPQAVSY